MSAVEEYRYPENGQWKTSLADAAIAELEAENEHDEDNLAGLEHALVRANQRYTRAEATIERLSAITPEQLAEKFHATYEGAADAMNYQTRPESAVPWGSVPARNKALMVATCAEVLAWMAERGKP